MSSKINEAQEHCRAAEKFLKTSIFRWKPDLDSAADEYNQAAQCFRIGRDFQKSREYYKMSSELYKQNKSMFYAAKALETAITVGKDISSSEELYEWARDACHLYQIHGSGDSGASVLDKTANIIEERALDLAVKLYQQAADVSSATSNEHQGSAFTSKASRLLVKACRFDEAVDSIRREIGFHQESRNMGAIGRLTVAIVLVQLARGDVVAAEKAYKEWGASCEVYELGTIEQLLEAYSEGDRELATHALSSPFITNMDVEYSRLARSIPLPQHVEPVHRPGVRENAAPAYVSGQASNVDMEAYRLEVGSRLSRSAIPEEDSPYEALTFGSRKDGDGNSGLC